MIIRNCLKLLSELSQIEDKINQIEQDLKRKGLSLSKQELFELYLENKNH